MRGQREKAWGDDNGIIFVAARHRQNRDKGFVAAGIVILGGALIRRVLDQATTGLEGKSGIKGGEERKTHRSHHATQQATGKAF